MAVSQAAAGTVREPYFGIRAVDGETGRGIPLIEFRTVNNIRFVTDNAGWVAFHEPGLMDRDVWFDVSGPGYERKKDGFGFAGVRLKPVAGEAATVSLRRTNIAERVGRLTGQGLYRDSELLGLPHPLPNLNSGGVLGQDSVQAVPWRGRIFWLWGDTSVHNYPLGNYHTTCATSDPHATPERGIAFDYFLDPDHPGRLRKMLPREGPGAVWMFGLLNVPDSSGAETLVAHYGRHPGLKPALEHGIATFNAEMGRFEATVPLDLAETWRFPDGNSVAVEMDGRRYFAFADPFLHVRVPATLDDVLNPAKYEALRYSESSRKWEWQTAGPPTTQADERKLLESGAMNPADARYRLTDAATGRPIEVHGASIRWNNTRKRWILIALQKGDDQAPSLLGEVWYSEAASPAGPWTRAVKIVSHPRYTYYNVFHHDHFDDGDYIHFEGTYTLEFSGNPLAPARYDYNQLMYRLNLSDPRLDAVRE